MTERSGGRNIPPASQLIAPALVILGIGLTMFVWKGLLWVAALGAFGPGILRELGWLRDKDEFQRQAAHRAGYHAYLIGGFVAAVSYSVLHTSLERPGEAAEWTLLILLVLWLTWLFSSLLAYWGAQKTTARLLWAVGAFWAAFAGATIVSEASWPGSAADVWVMLQGLLASVFLLAPFFLLPMLAKRHPRLAGGALLLMGGLMFVVFRGGSQPLATFLVTMTLLGVPLIASGVALVREGAGEGA